VTRWNSFCCPKFLSVSWHGTATGWKELRLERVYVIKTITAGCQEPCREPPPRPHHLPQLMVADGARDLAYIMPP
jgi:hypothetical protein